MATTLKFFDPADGAVEILPAASGGLNTIGFYGPGFGLSVRVGDFNEGTYRTSEDGQTDGSALPNLRWANVSGAYVAGEITATHLLEVLNSEATLRIELMTDVAVTTQNGVFRTFDKSSINNPPSGVDVYAAEIRNTAGPIGSGDSLWIPNLGGSGTVLDVDDKTVAATTHNWWIALSATPTSIGEKTNFAFYFETEFL
jgi:hypothetical protein